MWEHTIYFEASQNEGQIAYFLNGENVELAETLWRETGFVHRHIHSSSSNRMCTRRLQFHHFTVLEAHLQAQYVEEINPIILATMP